MNHDYNTLRTKWYNILKSEGFQDIECDVDSRGIKERTSLKGDLRGKPYSPELQRFYSECAEYLHSDEMDGIDNLWDKLIFSMFVEGATIRHISNTLRHIINLITNFPKEVDYTHTPQLSVFKIHGKVKQLVLKAKEYNYRNGNEG